MANIATLPAEASAMRRVVLDNGLTVYVRAMRTAPLVSSVSGETVCSIARF